jgi:NAD(P)-dependent dehydrogenase (short-subunit alcohol dehydrogenase family)
VIIDLKGRKAIVTGATAAIGRVDCGGLIRTGASVVINGRGEERISAGLRDMREHFPAAHISGFAADLATEEGARSFTAQATDADILVNNLGTAKPKPFLELTDGDWRDLFEINVMRGVRMTRHYLPAMTKRGGVAPPRFGRAHSRKTRQEIGRTANASCSRIIAGRHRNSRADLEEGPGRREAIEQVRRARLVSERSNPPAAR